MEKNNSDIFIVCGERSGDLHGSQLIKKLLNRNSELKIHFWGGELMEKAGGILLENYKSYNVMGFWEVITRLGFLYKKIELCKKHILEYRPKLILLIDFPGFNMRIAKFSHENGFKVHYYIPPKAWAWNSGRAIKLKKYVEKIYSILPFEIDFFRKYNCNIKYVGNPISSYIEKGDIQLEKSEKIISLLPGSRNSELKYSVPIFKKIIEILSEYKFKVCAVDNVDQKLYEDFNNFENTELVYDNTYKVVSSSKLSIVMSGTASLEVAFTDTPQVVVYKTSNLSFILAKFLINVKYISLVNLILNKSLVRELIQNDFNHKYLLKEINYLEDPINVDKALSGYKKLREIIGTKNAADEVEKSIIKSL